MGGRSLNKTAGTAWEYDFVAQALSKGFDVYMPCGELPVDCMVVNSAGMIYRVQCKGTAHNNKTKSGNSDRYKIIAGTGSSSKTPIDCTKVDIVACYIAPEKTWYLIPCLAMDGHLSMWFYPTQAGSKSKYARYKEDWSVFKT